MIDERARVVAARDQVQRIRARLVRVVEEVKERAAGILADTTMLIDKMGDGVESLAYKGTSEEEPFEEDPKKEV